MLAGGAVAVAAVAGCSSGPDDGSSNDGGDVAWLSWVPASELSDELDAIHLDVAEAVETFPDSALNDIGIQDISSTYNVDLADVNNFVVVTDGAETTTTAVVLEAPLDADALIDQFSIGEQERESYSGYEIIQQDRGSNVALSDSALIVASSPRDYIDAEAGDTESLGDSEIETTISRVDAATLSGAISGDEVAEDTDLSAAPVRGGIGISAGEGNTANIDVHILFESADDAETVLGNDEDELVGAIEENETDTLVDLSQDGRYIVAELESESYSFDN